MHKHAPSPKKGSPKGSPIPHRPEIALPRALERRHETPRPEHWRGIQKHNHHHHRQLVIVIFVVIIGVFLDYLVGCPASGAPCNASSGGRGGEHLPPQGQGRSTPAQDMSPTGGGGLRLAPLVIARPVNAGPGWGGASAQRRGAASAATATAAGLGVPQGRPSALASRPGRVVAPAAAIVAPNRQRLAPQAKLPRAWCDNVSAVRLFAFGTGRSVGRPLPRRLSSPKSLP